MASRLDKVIGIYVRVPTQDTQYGPEYTFTKPSTSTTFMYYYYQLQYLTLHTLYFFFSFFLKIWKLCNISPLTYLNLRKLYII